MKRHIPFLSRFARKTDGTVLVELAVVMPIFLLLYFGLIDFGRLAFHVVTTEKALYNATRVAIVRSPLCPNVPTVNTRGPSTNGSAPVPFGIDCNRGSNICSNPGDITCTGSISNPTMAEIWPMIDGALPMGTTPANLQITYSYDPNLGFLGGPYVPIVTITLTDAWFTFVSPLGSILSLTGSTAETMPEQSLPFPPLSVSMPAEDLSGGISL